MLKSILLSIFGFSFFQDCCAKTIVLSTNNFVSLTGPVTSSSVDDVIKSFNSKNIYEYIQENKNINLYINSPGGSVFAGNHLVQYIKTLQASNVSVDCIGHNFMSMGFVIMQSCTTRYGLFDSIGMQHQMSLGMKGSIENFKNHFGLVERVNNMLIEMEIKKIGMDKQVYLSKILSDWWLYGEENLKSGVVDEMITVRCIPSVMIEKVKKLESFFGFEIEIEMSRCPILTDIKITEKSSKYSNTTEVHDVTHTNINKFYDYINYPINIKDILIEFRMISI
jgi:ATP-dependent Clp protease protease subunit